jgi:nucleotide-binding universal stress UspA family protein
VFTRMLVCYDGSASSKKALHAAVMLAHEQEAKLCCLTVEEGLPAYAGTIDEFQDVKEERDTYYTEIQADAKRIAAEHGLALATRIEAGHPAQDHRACGQRRWLRPGGDGPQGARERLGYVHGDDGGEGDAPRDL